MLSMKQEKAQYMKRRHQCVGKGKEEGSGEWVSGRGGER